MKKVISLFIILVMFIFCNGTFAAKKKKKEPSIKHKIEFVTKDKFILSGDIYFAQNKSSKPLVILLHSFGLNSYAWKDLALALRAKDFNVLAMDLRGHGRSVYNESLKLKSRYKFTQNDWRKLPDDVIQSVSYIKANYPYINCDDVIIVGADIGASTGILAGKLMKKEPVKFVMISPMLNFKGLYIPYKVANYSDTKFLVLLSKSDKILFNFYTKTKPIIKTYPLGGPGNQLLKVNPESINDIVNFIN